MLTRMRLYLELIVILFHGYMIVQVLHYATKSTQPSNFKQKQNSHQQLHSTACWKTNETTIPVNFQGTPTKTTHTGQKFDNEIIKTKPTIKKMFCCVVCTKTMSQYSSLLVFFFFLNGLEPTTGMQDRAIKNGCCPEQSNNKTEQQRKTVKTEDLTQVAFTTHRIQLFKNIFLSMTMMLFQQTMSIRRMNSDCKAQSSQVYPIAGLLLGSYPA